MLHSEQIFGSEPDFGQLICVHLFIFNTAIYITNLIFRDDWKTALLS